MAVGKGINPIITDISFVIVSRKTNAGKKKVKYIRIVL